MSFFGDILSFFGQQSANRTNQNISAATNAANLASVQATNRSNRQMQSQANKLTQKEHTKARKFAASQSQKARDLAREQADIDRAQATRFAKNSTGWAFDDLIQSADEAGIHRLAALGGASGASYVPAGGSAPVGSAPGAGHIGASRDEAFLASAYSGSVVGDGLGLIGEAIDAGIAEKRAQEADAYDRAREAKRDELSARVAESEILRNQADAAMLAATSRTRLAEAARAARDTTNQEVIRPQENQPSGTTIRTKGGTEISEPSDANLIGIDELPHLLVRAARLGAKAVAKKAKETKPRKREKGDSIRW